MKLYAYLTLTELLHLPHIPLPHQAYLPGHNARPTELEGIKTIKTYRDSNLKNIQAYLHGWDLANHHFHWESHEAWELAWNGWGRHSKKALVTQGLIFITAAHLKLKLQQPLVAEKLYLKGKNRLFNEVETCSELGFNPITWLKHCKNIIDWPYLKILPTCF